LVTLWPGEIEDATIEGRIHVIRALRRELREERRRALEYATDYDAGRHHRLLASCRIEEQALQKVMRSEFDTLSAYGRHGWYA
jgi:hypothetical protein